VDRKDSFRVSANEWHHIKVLLWTDMARYEVDDHLFAETRTMPGVIPDHGRVGFYSYATSWDFKNVDIREA